MFRIINQTRKKNMHVVVLSLLKYIYTCTKNDVEMFKWTSNTLSENSKNTLK